MVTSQFGAILKEFEAFFKCPLEPDANDSCLIKMNNEISFQIELDRNDQLLIGIKLGTLPSSRYRDNLLKQALKSNESTHPSNGVFGFSHKTNQLILFIHVDPKHLNHDRIQTLLPAFILKAKTWSDAITNGKTPSLASTETKKPSGLFGLISK